MLFSLTGNSFAAEAIPEGDASSVQVGEIEFTSLEEGEMPQTFSLEEDGTADTGFEAGELRMGKITPIDPETLKEYQEEFGVEVKDSNSPEMRAAVVDLAVSGLKPRLAQPLPNNVVVEFEFILTNKSSQSFIGNVPISIYADGEEVMSVEGEVEMPSQSSTVCVVQLSNKFGGSHTVQVKVDPTNILQDIHYENNIVHGTFKWQDIIYLVASSIIPERNFVFGSDEWMPFLFRITNFGSLEAIAPRFQIKLGNSILYDSIDNPDKLNIASKKAITGSINLNFSKSSSYTISLVVDPAKTSGDVDYSDNTISCTIVVHPEHAIFAGKWPAEDIKKLNIGITPSALSMIPGNSNNDKINFVKNAAYEWNGILPNVNFGSVEVSEEVLNYPIHISSASTSDEGVLAVTFPYKFVNGNAVEMDPLTDSSNFYHMQMYLIKSEFPNYADSQKKRTLTHEFGHALGLAHPNNFGSCRDIAMMKQSYDSFASSYIETHDEYCLKTKY